MSQSLMSQSLAGQSPAGQSPAGASVPSPAAPGYPPLGTAQVQPVPAQPVMTQTPVGQTPAGQPAAAQPASAGAASPITLTPEDSLAADKIAETVNLSNPLSIQNINRDNQKALAGFNAQILDRAKVADAGEAGALIMEVVTKAKNFDTTKIEGKKGLGASVAKLFGRAKDEVTLFKARYETVAKQFDAIEKRLHENTAMVEADFAQMGQLAALIYQEFKRLEITIVGCQRRLEYAETVERPDIEARAATDIHASQQLSSFNDAVRQLRKKIDNMQRLRLACIQTEFVIARIRDNALGVIQANEETIYTGLEQWKQGFTIALTLDNQKKAVAFTNAVNDMAEEQRRRNAELMKTASLEVAEANERSSISYEGLAHTNSCLIETYQGIARIHQEADARLRDEQSKIAGLELELKQLVHDGGANPGRLIGA